MNTSWAKEKNVISCYKFPDDSLKVCGDETVHFGHPGISGKWLEWSWSRVGSPNLLEHLIHLRSLEIILKTLRKLDGVGPVVNRPSTDKLHHFVKKKNKKINYIGHVTRDVWHVTRMWHVTCCGGWTFSPNFSSQSSYCLWFMILWRSGGKGSQTDWINQWINEWRGCL